MIPFPLQTGQFGQSRFLGGALLWGAQNVQSASTTSAPAISNLSAKGYLLVAVIMRSSAPVSEPSGWTLVSSAEEPSGNLQRTDVYVRLSTGAGVDAPGATVTFSQASSGRMIGQIISVYWGNDPGILEAEANSHSSSVSGSYAVPSLTARGWGRIAIAIASFSLANTSPTSTTISATAGWTIITGSSFNQNRVGIFYRFIGPDEAANCTISTSVAGTGNATGHMLMFAPAV